MHWIHTNTTLKLPAKGYPFRITCFYTGNAGEEIITLTLVMTLGPQTVQGKRGGGGHDTRREYFITESKCRPGETLLDTYNANNLTLAFRRGHADSHVHQCHSRDVNY